MADEYIKIRGARVNNLKNINLDIPRNKLIVITGVSGSGKSSLAFETLFAEGQRRFAESISSFARQFLGRIQKPDADSIIGLPPAIAIEQKVNTRNPRSTVGTITEIYDYLRLIFARIGKTYSPISNKEVKIDTPEDVLKFISSCEKGKIVYILADISWKESEYRVENLLNLREEGYTRLYFHPKGELARIEDLLQDPDKFGDEYGYLLVDRLPVSNIFEDPDTLSRATDSVGSAFAQTGYIAIAEEESEILHYFSNIYEADGIRFEEPTEWLFNYNNPVGACKACDGFGKIIGIDESLVIPNSALSIYQGAIACWRGDSMREYLDALILAAPGSGISIHTPYHDLTIEQKDLIWQGNQHFTGIIQFFRMLESAKYKIQNKYMVSRYSGKTPCRVCNGSRLRKEALYIKVGGKNIAELLDMSIGDLSVFFKDIDLSEYDRKIADRAIKEVVDRISYLENVGLSYLTLSRASNTLSGGESQRVNLVSSIGNTLTGSMYILDEPSIGLHSRDTQRLISVLKRLRDLGNTVIVVEHDEEIMRASDHLIDIGPYAGIYGGEVVFQGDINDPEATKGNDKSLTIKYLSGLAEIRIPEKRRTPTHFIEITGARENNLKSIDVKFPLKVLTAVTGVSGSGKSSLVGDILYPVLNRYFNKYGQKPGIFTELKGDLGGITAVEYIDQNPIGKSTRSNPATYLKIYDEIRKLFSEQPYAKANGYGHSHFSFNIDGGRCPECLGEGKITIDMQFMADVQVTCEACEGKRFLPDILEVKYQGKNINDILSMSVNEAIEFFAKQKEPIAKRIAEKIRPLDDVGLSYVQLGQSSSTLSGGESQRVKLASFLSKEAGRESIFFIFDEPTTGLHLDDIKKLLKSFNALIDRGHTILIVEHNKDVIKTADWIIELGPDAGVKGGELVYSGPFITT